MEDLVLINPKAENAEEIRLYRQELEADGSFSGCSLLRKYGEPLEWLKMVEMYSQKDTCPENWVVTTQFICVRKSDERLVGMIQLRHCLNEYLYQYGGHIGYNVRPSERRKGYAKYMLGKCLSYAKEQIGLDLVMISCSDTNQASRRTILAHGGIYENTVFNPDEGIKLKRYWIYLD